MQSTLLNRAFPLLLTHTLPCVLSVVALGQEPGQRSTWEPPAATVPAGSLAFPIDFADTDRIPDFVYRRTAEFLAINQNAVEFSDKVPYAVQPIYAHGVDGIAYYEVWLTRAGLRTEGWLLVSATDADYPLVNFSHEGTPYSQQVIARANELGETILPNDRIFRFGVSYFSLETPEGQLVADFGAMPSWLPTDEKLSGSGSSDSDRDHPDIQEEGPQGIEWVHYFPIHDYQDLLTYFPRSYFTTERAELAADMRQRIFPDEGHGEAFDDDMTSAYIYRYIFNYNNQTFYTQIPAFYRYNWAGCWSGCTNNAWANVYGWWDKNMGKGNLIPTTATGDTCPTYRNTYLSQDVVDPAQMTIRGDCGTYCWDGAGATPYFNVHNGYNYAWRRGYGFSNWYQWCTTGGCSVTLANIVIDCIGNNARPAHIGTSSHSWVGTGLCQWDMNIEWTWVYAYPGWSENHSQDVWIFWRDLHTADRVFVY